MESRVKKFLVTDKVTVKEAMRQIGKAGERVLFVVDDQYRLLGSLTDGDLRRWVLKNGSLASTIARVYNKHPNFVGERYNLEEVKKRMLKNKITWIPVVDKAGKVQNVLLWNSIFTDEGRPVKGKINIPVVIMAGGKGTRLDPFTRILPKPLIPIGDKAIIEVIMDKFHCYGVEEFHVSINHKSKMIKAYFEEMKIPYKIHYIEEEKPLGTAGGIKFLQDKIKGSILVSNCDIIIEADYREMVDFHKKRDNDITIIGSFRHFTIPYGICTIENGGNLLKIDEKPEYDYLVNTGMYLLKQSVLDLIPRNKYFDITDLIKAARYRMKKIGVFPIDEKSWIDVGQWEEYQRALRAIKAE